jgi:hypothetical protein
LCWDRRVGEIDEVDPQVVALLGLPHEPVGYDGPEPALPNTAHDHRECRGGTHGREPIASTIVEVKLRLRK